MHLAFVLSLLQHSQKWWGARPVGPKIPWNGLPSPKSYDKSKPCTARERSKLSQISAFRCRLIGSSGVSWRVEVSFLIISFVSYRNFTLAAAVWAPTWGIIFVWFKVNASVSKSLCAKTFEMDDPLWNLLAESSCGTNQRTRKDVAVMICIVDHGLYQDDLGADPSWTWSQKHLGDSFFLSSWGWKSAIRS